MYHIWIINIIIAVIIFIRNIITIINDFLDKDNYKF